MRPLVLKPVSPDHARAREPQGERPRPIYCASWHVHQELEVADAVCRGRFEHEGISLELGLPPDWNGALPDDEEWGITWNKFYFGLDLACAYRVTGEIRYLEAWETLVESWIEQTPTIPPPSDVSARRIQNWVFAWSGFASVPGFPGLSNGLAELLLESLAVQVRAIRNDLTPERNHRTLELFSLSIVAFAFPKLDPDGALLAFAASELHRNLIQDILCDGVHREQSTHYHMIVLRNLLAFRENARRFAMPIQAGFDQRLQLACDFALQMHRPDGTIPSLSDSDGGSYLELFELAAGLFDREDFRFVATRGREGKPPELRRTDFPAGGYYIERSDWRATAKAPGSGFHLMFDCGPLGAGGHGHYDALHVELFAGGKPLLVDPGRFTYDEADPNWRRWFKSTHAHNTVCVDGLDQTPYRRGKPRAAPARARFRQRCSTPSLDLMCGEVKSAAYSAVHTRRVIGIGGAYWLIVDALRDQHRHHYDLRFHLAEGDGSDLELSTAASTTRVRSRSARFEIWPRSEVSVEAGWLSPSYGVKQPAPILSCVLADRSDADFVTLISPSPTTERRILDASVSADESGFVHIGTAGGISEWIAWGEDRPCRHESGFEFDAAAVLLRLDGQGRWLACEAAGCRSVIGPDGTLYESGGSKATVQFDARTGRFAEASA